MRTEEEIRQHRDQFEKRYEQALLDHDLDRITVTMTGAALLSWVLGDSKEEQEIHVE